MPAVSLQVTLHINTVLIKSELTLLPLVEKLHLALPQPHSTVCAHTRTAHTLTYLKALTVDI